MSWVGSLGGKGTRRGGGFGREEVVGVMNRGGGGREKGGLWIDKGSIKGLIVGDEMFLSLWFIVLIVALLKSDNTFVLLDLENHK